MAQTRLARERAGATANTGKHATAADVGLKIPRMPDLPVGFPDGDPKELRESAAAFASTIAAGGSQESLRYGPLLEAVQAELLMRSSDRVARLTTVLIWLTVVLAVLTVVLVVVTVT